VITSKRPCFDRSRGWQSGASAAGARNAFSNPYVLFASVGLFAFAVLVDCNTAGAQIAADSGGAGLEEVIVTARRREERNQDTPISIEAFSTEALEARNVFSLTDIAKFTPNFQMSPSSENSGASFAPQIYIRGIGQPEYLATADPGVGVYLDGVYMARAIGQSPEIVDFESIQVLRGPQGTLFGKNTVGGAINMVSKPPSDIPGGYVEATGGNLSRKDLKMAVEGPLGSSALIGRIAFATLNQDGFIDRTVTDEKLGGWDSNLGRGTLVWNAAGQLRITISADYTHTRGDSSPGNIVAITPTGLLPLWNALVGGPGGHPITPADLPSNPYQEMGTGPNVNELDLFGASVTVDTQSTRVAIKSITAERGYRAEFGNDLGHSVLDYATTLALDHQHQISEEIQLSGDALNTRLKWVGGLFYLGETWSDRNAVTLAHGLYTALESLPGAVIPLAPYPVGPNGLPLFTCPAAPVGFPCAGGAGNPINVALDIDFSVDNTVDDKSYAAFSQGTYEITNEWSVTAGVRFSHEQKSFSINQIREPSDVPVVPLTTVSNDWTSFTPRFDIDYKISSDNFLYVSASRGYKGGGFNGRPTSQGAVNAFAPEFVWSYEFGSKNEWFDRRLRVNADVFSMDYSNIQLTSLAADRFGSLVEVVENAGKGKIQGAELDVAARPSPTIQLDLSGAFLDARYTELNPGVTNILLSNKFIKAPRWSGTTGAQFTWPLANRSAFEARADYSYTSRTENDALNTPAISQGPYGQLGVRTQWYSGNRKWMVALFGTNLTNKIVKTSGASGLSSLGIADADYGPPREYGVTVRFTF
jgi:iron complex outermembrane receptor protein